MNLQYHTKEISSCGVFGYCMATEDTTHIPSQQQSIQITDNLLEELNVFQTQKISNSTFQTKAGLKMWQNFV